MDVFSNLLTYDERLFILLNTLPHPPLVDQIFLFFSFYPLVIWVLVGLVVVFVEEKKEPWFVVRLLLALLFAGTLASVIIKPLVGRPRPDITHGTQVILVPEKAAAIPANNDFAFPSGHAAIAFAGAYILTREETHSRHSKKHSQEGKRSLKLLFLGFAILTAFSRIYLGKHYPLDVVAGGALGWSMGWAAWKIVELIRPKMAFSH